MFDDKILGMNVREVGFSIKQSFADKSVFAKSRVMCGYWDYTAGGYHAVVLYKYKHRKGVWATFPNGGIRVQRANTIIRLGGRLFLDMSRK